MGGVVERAVESARPLIDRRRHELSVSLPDGTDLARRRPDATGAGRREPAQQRRQVHRGRGPDLARPSGRRATRWSYASGTRASGSTPKSAPTSSTCSPRRIGRSTARKGGLGIGLALVQRLVEMHRGTVEAHSEGLGRGAEFTVRLPLLLSPARTPAKPPRPADPPAPGSRILVVDDNEDSAEMLAKLLAMSGHDVRTAYTGPTALEAAAAYLPDVVLLDIGLPGINGYEVARRLRQIPRLEGVKIIAMTGYGQEADIRLAQEAGFDSHQVKPIDFVKVLELLTTMLSPQGSGA